MCVCVFMYIYNENKIKTDKCVHYTLIYIYSCVYTYIYMCVCVYVYIYNKIKTNKCVPYALIYIYIYSCVRNTFLVFIFQSFIQHVI